MWMYFGLKADEKGQPLNTGEAICRLCRKIVLAKGGNTTNLRSHLTRRHRSEFYESNSSVTPGVSLDAQGTDPLNLVILFANNSEFYVRFVSRLRSAAAHT